MFSIRDLWYKNKWAPLQSTKLGPNSNGFVIPVAFSVLRKWSPTLLGSAMCDHFNASKPIGNERIVPSRALSDHHWVFFFFLQAKIFKNVFQKSTQEFQDKKKKLSNRRASTKDHFRKEIRSLEKQDKTLTNWKSHHMVTERGAHSTSHFRKLQSTPHDDWPKKRLHVIDLLHVRGDHLMHVSDLFTHC